MVKKMLIATLSLLLLTSLVACKTESEEEAMITGGWTEKDEEITEELQAIFDEATEGLTGAKYKALKLVGTQVVSGTNYKFLAEITKITASPTTKECYVIIYVDLDGNATISEIIEE